MTDLPIDNTATTQSGFTLFDSNLKNVLLGKVILTLFALFLLTGAVFAAPAGTTPIWRAQIYVTTANRDDANSDDYVKVDLNPDNRTWIESDENDFEKGLSHYYDLRLDNVKTLDDIKYLKIEKTGDDGWCIKQVYLVINSKTIFYKDFGPGLWLDTNGSRIYYVDGSFMRSASEWTGYTSPVKPYVTGNMEMRWRIEAAFGDFVAYDHIDINDEHDENGLLMKGPNGTTISTINGNTWRVKKNLESDTKLYNKDITLNFDLKVTCLNGHLNFTPANLRADMTFPDTALTRATNFTIYTLPLRLNQMMKNFTYGPLCTDMSIVLSSNGDLNVRPITAAPVNY